MNTVFWISFGALWALVAIQGFAFLEVLRQLGQIRERLGPEVGALIVPGAVNTGALLPELRGLAATDLRPVTWDDYLNTEVSAVVILRANCSSCQVVARDLTGFAKEVKAEATVVALVEGTVAEVQAFIAKTQLDPRMVIIDEGGTTTRRLGVTFDPGAVIVRGRTLGYAAIVNSVKQVHALIHEKERKEAMGSTTWSTSNPFDALTQATVLQARRIEDEPSG